MSDESSYTHALLIGGPCAGTYGIEEFQSYVTRNGLKIPFDEHFILTDKQPFAFAIYDKTNIPSDNVKSYWFRKFLKVEEGPFLVELVGGPLAGVRPMHQPVLGLPQLVIVPVKSEPALDGKGRQRVFAVYKNGAHLGGEHKLIFDGEFRDDATDNRIIFELSGGPYDGVTYDTDEILDHSSQFWAGANYTVTAKGQIGKRFMVMSPHFKQALEEFGDEAEKHGGPFSLHMYEVTGKVEAPFEIYVQAKYVGLHREQ
jgi:hypothetical protein